MQANRLRSGIAALFLLAAAGLLLRPGALAAVFSSNYLPHSFCYLAQPWLIWSNVAFDSITAVSYFAIFAALFWLAGKLRNLPDLRGYLWVLLSFGLFIVACAATHVMESVTIWWPVYRFSVTVKAVAALASVATAAIFVAKAPAMAATVRRLFALFAAEHLHLEQLRKTQDFLERTDRIAGVGGWEVDLLRNHVEWTSGTYRIFAAPPDYRPSVESDMQFFPPSGKRLLLEAIDRASRTGQPWDLELCAVRTDGKEIWVRIVGEAVLMDGRTVRLAGAIQDKTVQVGIRHALRETNDRLTLATDSGAIGIYDWDIQADRCTGNHWLHRLWDLDENGEGHSLEAFAGRMHPEDRDATIAAISDGVAGRRPYHAEFRVVWRDGSVRHVSANGQVTHDEFGRAVRMIGVNSDVTEARRLTAELAEQHELFRVTLHSIRDGVVTKDVRRNVVWMNEAAERLTGWSVAEATGRPVTEIYNAVDEETRAPVDSHIDMNTLEDRTVSLLQPAVLIARDGRETPIESVATALRTANGEIMGSVLVIHDATEHRSLVAANERASRLQLDIKLKDEFLSHVSHELRSPLTSVYSFTSIVADNLAGETTPEQQEYLHIVLKNVLQLQSMIEDLLQVTQSREGKLSLHPQRVCVAEHVADAVDTMRGAAAAKNIYLVVGTPDGLDTGADLPPACADPVRLRQILIILLDNAIKFTPEGGSVGVRVSAADNSRLLFQVADTGCGVPFEHRSRIFEKLFQITGPGHADTAQAGRIGLGLGLHIARDLVRRQGGNIWVSGEAGEGSTFNFTLPVFLEDAVAAPRPETEPYAGVA